MQHNKKRINTLYLFFLIVSPSVQRSPDVSNKEPNKWFNLQTNTKTTQRKCGWFTNRNSTCMICQWSGDVTKNGVDKVDMTEMKTYNLLVYPISYRTEAWAVWGGCCVCLFTYHCWDNCTSQTAKGIVTQGKLRWICSFIPLISPSQSAMSESIAPNFIRFCNWNTVAHCE